METTESLLRWQIACIKEGLRQAEAGEFATDAEVKAAFAKWRQPLKKSPRPSDRRRRTH